MVLKDEKVRHRNENCNSEMYDVFLIRVVNSQVAEALRILPVVGHTQVGVNVRDC